MRRSVHERRRYQRADGAWEVSLETPDGRALTGRMLGLSPVGAKVRLSAKKARPPEGAVVQVRFAPAKGELPLAIQGLVWRTDTDGAALVFVNLSTEDFLRVKKLVEALRRE